MANYELIEITCRTNSLLHDSVAVEQNTMILRSKNIYPDSLLCIVYCEIYFKPDAKIKGPCILGFPGRLPMILASSGELINLYRN